MATRDPLVLRIDFDTFEETDVKSAVLSERLLEEMRNKQPKDKEFSRTALVYAAKRHLEKVRWRLYSMQALLELTGVKPEDIVHQLNVEARSNRFLREFPDPKHVLEDYVLATEESVRLGSIEASFAFIDRNRVVQASTKRYLTFEGGKGQFFVLDDRLRVSWSEIACEITSETIRVHYQPRLKWQAWTESPIPHELAKIEVDVQDLLDIHSREIELDHPPRYYYEEIIPYLL